MDEAHRYFAIHGDNIVECERTLRLIELALSRDHSLIQGPAGSPTNPSFTFSQKARRTLLKFVFFPGFGRWNVDIRQIVRDRGGIVREAPDIILSEYTLGHETPLFAIEYSGALAAGNQAWQRNGRAYSFGLARIPYLYVAELGGYELDAERSRRAPRLPNPAVPFSYISASSTLGTTILPVYIPNPGMDHSERARYIGAIGHYELVEFIRRVILGESVSSVTASLQEKALTFVQKLASRVRGGRTLTPEQWGDLYQAVNAGSNDAILSYLLKETSLSWSKTAYIKRLTVSAKELMQVAARLAVGLTSTNLPMCIIPSENRKSLANEIERLYPRISCEFLDWLRCSNPLVICWVMGFKPRGDDARPDRGLPPFARMLVGPDTEILTVVYGPARREDWTSLIDDPRGLSNRNGLWESIMATSTAILADSATDSVTNHGFLRTDWEQHMVASAQQRPLPIVAPPPQRIGEHDVDTVVHTIFARLGGESVFEGLCNPPGGDWSGISLLNADQNIELRWLSLPRVGGPGTKRPDHVLQLFDLGSTPVVVAIESKEKPTSVENGIGYRLKNYVANLLDSPASVERQNDERSEWRHSNLTLHPDDLRLASAAAFLMRSHTDLTNVRQRTNTDIQIGLRFDADRSRCEIHLLTSTAIGREIARFISLLPISRIGLSVHIHQ